jgi:hypothetical protein
MIAELELQSQKKKVKLIIAAILTAVFLPLILITAFATMVRADGNGSPEACLDKTVNVLGSQGGTDNGGSEDLATVDVGAGNTVTGVCIKSGNNMFSGNQHSGVLGNGTYENECYTVVGVGTQEVTVTRIGEGSNCQGISHIDVVFTGEEAKEGGSLLVNKILLDAEGAQAGGNAEANTLGFRWGFDGDVIDNMMGTTVSDLEPDDYDVTENTVEGYDFVGYFLGREGSCSETEEDKTLPVTVTVEEEETTVATFCNQAEAENGGGGGGQVLGDDTGGQVLAAQVEAPVGGVGAGGSGSVMSSIFGLGTSLSALGYGVSTLRKKQ